MSLVWAHAPQKDGALLLLLALADFANDEGTCWPSIETLSKKSRMGERHVRRLLREFEEQGVIETQDRGLLHETNVYRIVREKLDKYARGLICPPPPQGGPGVHEGGPPSPGRGVPIAPQASGTVIEPSIGEPSKVRPRNPLFDILCEVEGTNPNELGKSGGGRIARALQDIKGATPDVTPEEIKRRAGNYRSSWPSVTLTATSLALHWAKFGTATTHDQTTRKPNGRSFEGSNFKGYAEYDRRMAAGEV